MELTKEQISASKKFVEMADCIITIRRVVGKAEHVNMKIKKSYKEDENTKGIK